mmetsp:Transcript_35407/g.101097  ORF Transcript_35407/g.101097 Transcript_35407/m.101097 type:complete len:528 (+) Transcript_35407:511-2094(+)
MPTPTPLDTDCTHCLAVPPKHQQRSANPPLKSSHKLGGSQESCPLAPLTHPPLQHGRRTQGLPAPLARQMPTKRPLHPRGCALPAQLPASPARRGAADARLEPDRSPADDAVPADAAHPAPGRLDAQRRSRTRTQKGNRQHLRRLALEEELGGTHLQAIGRDVRQQRLEATEQHLRRLGEATAPHLELHSPAQVSRGQAPVVQHRLAVPKPHRVSRTAHADGFQDPLIPQLLHNGRPVEGVCDALRVGLDAPDEVGGRGTDVNHEGLQLLPELGGHGVCLCPRHTHLARRDRCLRSEDPPVIHEPLLDEGLGTALHAIQSVGTKRVLVLGQEGLGVILHRTSKMPHDEVALPVLHDLEKPAAAVAVCQLPVPGVGRATDDVALLVQHGQHAREGIPAVAAEKLHDKLVVREVLRVPLHALTRVERRLVLKYNLVKILLQQLIGEINAELLERVALEELEAENVKNPDKRQCVLTGSCWSSTARHCINHPASLLHLRTHLFVGVLLDTQNLVDARDGKGEHSPVDVAC